MPKFKVVVPKHGYESLETERRIIEAAGGEIVDAGSLNDEQTLALCAEADALLVRWMRITPAVLARLRRCQIIVRYGIGFDNIDVGAATERGVIVGHVPSYCLDDVATHALALWLACVRRVAETHGKIAGGGWDNNPPEKIWRTAGKTFGIVGLGNIGATTARKLAGWNMRLLACDPYIDPVRAETLGATLVDLETLCRESDYISLHVPLLRETRHLINASTLGQMKRGVILVNTARGPVMDGAAVLDALNSGHVAFAGIDVFEEEPLPADSGFRRHPHVVLSDHLAWYSEESFAELRATVAEEAVRVCTGGLPKAIANPEVLHKLGRWSEWNPPENVRWQFKRIELF